MCSCLSLVTTLALRDARTTLVSALDLIQRPPRAQQQRPKVVIRQRSSSLSGVPGWRVATTFPASERCHGISCPGRSRAAAYRFHPFAGGQPPMTILLGVLKEQCLFSHGGDLDLFTLATRTDGEITHLLLLKRPQQEARKSRASTVAPVEMHWPLQQAHR